MKADGPVECAAWCVEGDGHGTDKFRQDQYCHTGQQRIDLSLRPWLPDEVRDDAGQSIAAPDHIKVSASRQPGEQTIVDILHTDAACLEVTVAEARALRDALGQVLRQIDDAVER